MSRTLSIRNRQRVRRIDTALLRRLTIHILEQQLDARRFELAIHLIAEDEMARLNQTFLDHSGSTDVITFDHSDNTGPAGSLYGELFICLDDALKQASQFRTTWQCELVRYVVHGLLHLRGHDDSQPAARRRMKREENRILKATSKEFAITRLKRPGNSLIGGAGFST